MERLISKEQTAPLRVGKVLENAKRAMTVEEISNKAEASEEVVKQVLEFLKNKGSITIESSEGSGEKKYKVKIPDFA